MVERILDWVERNFLKAVALSIFALVLLLCMVVYNVGNATGRASLEKRDYGRSLMPLIQSASRSLSRAALPVPPVEYGGYTPTIYAAPADVGSGNGSSEANAQNLADALVDAMAGDIVGLIPGTYTAADIAASDSVPAWQTTNSGSSGNPIRIVAKYPAVANASNRSELRTGAATAWTGNPTFGALSKDYVEWLGIYVDETVSHSTGTCGVVSIADSNNCAVKYCVIVGAGDHISDSLRCAIRLENNDVGNNVVSYNHCSNFSPGITNANEFAILILDSVTVLVEHNEVEGSAGGVFVKHNHEFPGDLTIRYNYVHDCWGGIRVDSNCPIGDLAYDSYVYQNLIENCTGTGLWFANSGNQNAANTIMQNNTLVSCGVGNGTHQQPFETGAGHKFWNNIVYDPTQAMNWDNWSTGELATLPTADFSAEHNLYYSAATFLDGDVMSAQTLGYWQGLGQDSASPAASTSDPLFVGSGSYKLQGGSPALTLGRDHLNISGLGVNATIPAGCYITDSEVIGTGY